MACLTSYITVSMLTAPSCRITAPKHFIKSLIGLDRLILMWNRLVTLCFLLIEHIYWVTNFLDKEWKEIVELGGRRSNQDMAGLARLDGNTSHMRVSFLLWRAMISWKCIKCSNGSPSSSYIYNLGNIKYGGASWWRIGRTNGEVDMSSNTLRVGS